MSDINKILHDLAEIDLDAEQEEIYYKVIDLVEEARTILEQRQAMHDRMKAGFDKIAEMSPEEFKRTWIQSGGDEDDFEYGDEDDGE